MAQKSSIRDIGIKKSVLIVVVLIHMTGCAGQASKGGFSQQPSPSTEPFQQDLSRHARPAVTNDTRATLPLTKLSSGQIHPTPPPPHPAPSPGLVGELHVPPGGFTLPELVDLALTYNPSTRRAWASIRAAEATVGMARGEYWPALELAAGIDRTDGYLPLFPSEVTENYFQSSIGLTYLLFDFGGRRARVDATRIALQAAGREYSQNIQDVVLRVAASYYRLIGAQADLKASEDTLDEANTNLASARALLEAGLGTRPDVLLMQARQAQAVLSVVSRRGDLAIACGALATATGLPANTELPLAEPETVLEIDAERLRIEELIDTALQNRPDLGATWDRLNRAQTNAREASSRMWPTLELAADVAWLKGEGYFNNDFSVEGINYQAGLVLTYPLFEGFALRNGVRRANAIVEEARAAFREKQESVIQQVWDSYQQLVTAGQQVTASRKLLESAELSYAAALTAYRAGLNTIPELVEAQTTLSDARYADVDARTAWHVALVQLARDMGRIPVSGEPSFSSQPPAGPATKKRAGP